MCQKYPQLICFLWMFETINWRKFDYVRIWFCIYKRIKGWVKKKENQMLRSYPEIIKENEILGETWLSRKLHNKCIFSLKTYKQASRKKITSTAILKKRKKASVLTETTISIIMFAGIFFCTVKEQKKTKERSKNNENMF